MIRVLPIGRRGSISLLFSLSIVAMLTAAGIALNMGYAAQARAILQRAVDSAALSGAAAYSLNAASFNTLAIQTATSAFCDATINLPRQLTLISQSGMQSCNSGAGPLVTAVIDSYITGTPGISHGGGISCSGTYLPAAPYSCGFIVTVSASVTLQPVISRFFGGPATISATGMAVNPFIDFSKIFSLPAGVVSGAKYANSVWAYALSLNAAGAPDYSSNGGAVPDTSACNGGPDQVTCGAFVMLASTMYAAKGIGYTPPSQTVTYDNGVVRNPASPTGITATTPLGVAFKSIAGGNYVQYSPPGVYGYQVLLLGINPPAYVYAPNGCIYPYHNLVYNTVGQVWATNPQTTIGYAPMLPWNLVTHWFYSSYLSNNLAPSQGEIAAQLLSTQDIPSVTADAAQSGGNIAGMPTYNAIPLPPVSSTCPATTKIAGITFPNDIYTLTTFPAIGLSNCSLYIVQSSSPGNVTPTNSGFCFDPTATPGQAYAALNCQQFGSYYYTFFWNDMGGAQIDNKNYADGIVQISCASAAHVALIQ